MTGSGNADPPPEISSQQQIDGSDDQGDISTKETPTESPGTHPQCSSLQSKNESNDSLYEVHLCLPGNKKSLMNPAVEELLKTLDKAADVKIFR